MTTSTATRRKNKNRKNKVMLEHRIWRNRAPRLILSGIRDEFGHAYGNAEDSQEALATHWAGVFSEKEIDQDSIDEVLRHAVQFVPSSEHALIDRSLNKPSSTRGILHQAQTGIHMLHGVFVHISHHMFLSSCGMTLLKGAVSSIISR